MATITSTKRSKYPGPADLKEGVRLKAQHDLVTDAIGSLVLCPVDLSKPNLRILDSGTGSGVFLSELRPLLAHPDSATLIGADIKPWEVQLPSYIEWHQQDVREAWPTEWEGTFDFVHQRAVMANTSFFEEAINVVKKLAGLVKLDGWIQLVDGHMPDEPIKESDPPSQRFLKVTGQFLASHGLSPTNGMRIEEELQLCGLVENVKGRAVKTRIGKGGKQELEHASRIWVSGMRHVIGAYLGKMEPKGPMTEKDFNLLMDEVEEEAETVGFDVNWWAAWGQRKA